MKKRWGWSGLGFLFAAGLACASVTISKVAPDFSLTDVEGKTVKLSDFKGRYVVLEWVNFGCPFVKKHYDSHSMQDLQSEAAVQNVNWLSICSSAPGKQGNLTNAEWKKALLEKGAHPTSVLLDPTGKVGKLYGAKTTPHMFVVNPQGLLIYQGAIDNRPSTDVEDVKSATNYVRQALAEATGGKPVTIPVTDSYGCSVKYK